jgi:hypothetical protein
MNDDPKHALWLTRIIWAAMIAGQVIFMVVVPVVWSRHATDGAATNVLFVISMAMLLTLVPFGYFVRMQVYKANWRDKIVTPGGYVTGNLILLAACEGVAMVGLVHAMLSGTLFPAVIPTILALVVQIINFPNGRAMQRDPFDL